MLCQTELLSGWSRWRDSNPRSRAPKERAMSARLHLELAGPAGLEPAAFRSRAGRATNCAPSPRGDHCNPSRPVCQVPISNCSDTQLSTLQVVNRGLAVLAGVAAPVLPLNDH